MPKSREALAKYMAAALDTGISKTELSRKTGIGRSMIDAYLKCENAVSVDNLDRIAAALDTTPAALLSDSAPAAPSLSPVKRRFIELIAQSPLQDSQLEALLDALGSGISGGSKRTGKKDIA